MPGKNVAIGIDLGTTKCCVGVVREGKVEILENERGNKTTPSYVAFRNTERLVGEDAKDQATVNTANTVFGVKGIIGRSMEDDQVKKASTNMPYNIVNNAGDPCINVTYKGEEEVLLPQQVTAMLLTKMRELAQTRLGCSVEKAVISVPASFSNAQRQATKDAATIAGLEVLALINDPTAAAIAYQANRKEEDEETIAVVDFGGGKLDVAIVSVSNICVTVNGMSGTMDLGGNAVDEILMTYLLEQFKERFSRDPPEGSSVLERLRAACVQLKHRLSLLPKVQDQLDCFGDEFILPISISRRQYDDLISNKISSCMSAHFGHALHASGPNGQNISRVVLVGGSTRIPLVPEGIKLFGGTKLDRSVNLDEAVAHGAAMYAALLNGKNSVTELAVNDILPNTFCMGAENSECVFLAPRIPTSRIHPFSDKEMKQKQEFYEVLVGRNDSHKFLGTLCLSQEFARAVSLVVKVCFNIDKCGIFAVHVHLYPNDIFRNVLHNNTARLSESELQDAVERENRFRKDDEDEEARIAALTDLKSKCFDLRSAMLTSKGKTCFPELVEEIVQQASETIDWLDTTTTVTRSECLKKMHHLTKLRRSLRDKIHELERLEKERVVSVSKLKLCCLGLEEDVKNENVLEEVELVAKISAMVKQNKEWLQTNEIPSTTACEARTAGLEKVHLELKTKVRERQQERARLAAIEELKCHCDILQAELTSKQRNEQGLPLVNKFAAKIKGVVNWLFYGSGQSIADCAAKKIALEKMLLEIQGFEREAEEHERIRLAAVNSLQIYCLDIRAKLENWRVIESDGPSAALLMTEVSATIAWIQEGKTFSESQCGEKENSIQSLLNAYYEAVKDKEKQITFRKGDDERRNTLKNFQAPQSHLKSSLLTEAVKKQHQALANDMVRSEREITEWLEPTKTFSRSEFEGRLEPLERTRDTLVTSLDETRKQLLVDAQQDASSEKQLLADAQQDASSESPASPIYTEGAAMNAPDKEKTSGDPKRSSKDQKDQDNRMNSDDAQNEKTGYGGSVLNNGNSMEQEGANGRGANGKNHGDSNNGESGNNN